MLEASSALFGDLKFLRVRVLLDLLGGMTGSLGLGTSAEVKSC